MRRPKGKGFLGLLAAGAWLALVVSPSVAPAQTPIESPPVRMTLEVSWHVPAAKVREVPFSGVDLDVAGGRVAGAVAWPGGEPIGTSPESRTGTGWHVSERASGRCRVRVDATLGAAVVVRAGGHSVRVPLIDLLTASRHTASGSPVEIGVERLAWDTLEIEPGAGMDVSPEAGLAEPGAAVPLAVGLNVLTPEPAEMTVRLTSVLRSPRTGTIVWQDDRQTILVTDQAQAPRVLVPLTAPREEGAYLLELRAAWEPVRESKGLSRLLLRKRRYPVSGGSATRRMSLTVLGPETGPPLGKGTATVVDTVDLTRNRPVRALAGGRGPKPLAEGLGWTVPEPALSLVVSGRWDRLRGWVPLVPNERHPWSSAGGALPQADEAGLAYLAVPLKAPHPGRPHRLTVRVAGGHPAALAVALVQPADPNAGPTARSRLLLDTCVAGPPVLDGAEPTSFSWIVWPDGPEPVAVLANRGTGAAVRPSTVELIELDGLPESSPADPSTTAPTRSMVVRLEGTYPLDAFGGGTDQGVEDLPTAAKNLAAYLKHCGATGVVVPESWACGDPVRPALGALDGQACEDRIAAPPLAGLTRALMRWGLSAWLELDAEAPLPGLPPVGSPEARTQGLVRGDPTAPQYQPLHPEVRRAWGLRVTEALTASKPAPAGLVLRLGPGATLPGPDSARGPDDATFERFVRATFDAETARAVPTRDPARQAFLDGPGRTAWRDWRSREIGMMYVELASLVKRTAPGAELIVVTPGTDPAGGPAAAEAHSADEAGLPPDDAWRALGLDLAHWPRSDAPTGRAGPIVLRGVDFGDPLGRDLAASPELDEQVAARVRRGAWIVSGTSPTSPASETLSRPMLTAAPPPPWAVNGLEEIIPPLTHAWAALDVHWIVLSASTASGRESGVRRFARVFRAVPVEAAGESAPPAPRQPSGVAVRTIGDAKRTFAVLANDLPFVVRIDTRLVPGLTPGTVVEDLDRGLRLAPDVAPGGGTRLVLDLPAHGVTVVRFDAPQVRALTVTPYPPQPVLTALKVQADGLSARLERLSNTEPVSSREPDATGAGHRQVRRTLLSALQAYRERRYADFARLAESRWVRQADRSSTEAPRLATTADAIEPPTAPPDPVPPMPLPPMPMAPAGGMDAGGSSEPASALPPARRLR